MNVLFIATADVDSINDSGIYSDLMRTFVNHGHRVCLMTISNKNKNAVSLSETDNFKIVRINIDSQRGSSHFFKKGISILKTPHWHKKAYRQYCKDDVFDIVVYSTPPITIYSFVRYIKKRNKNAFFYLLLKDIFPQNSVDIGILKCTGLKGIVYKCFRSIEQKLYQVSDKIGCMSEGNVSYLLSNNRMIEAQKVEVCPNSIEYISVSYSAEEKKNIRIRYNIPLDKKIFIYGGNLGKPQGIQFVMDCIKSQAENDKVFFLIVGGGTEYSKLLDFYTTSKQSNFILINRLPKNDYDMLMAACDIGLIFLDYRFTIPNFPSRLLGYMQAGLPVLACTDTATDIGKIITECGFGWWCGSNNVMEFNELINKIVNSDTTLMKTKELEYLKNNYTTEISYNTIMASVKGE